MISWRPIGCASAARMEKMGGTAQRGFRVEIHSGSPTLWARCGEEILEVERSAFVNPDERLPREVLERDVSDPTTIVGLLTCGGTLTGFTYLELPSRVSPGRDHEDADVRHVSDTAIRRELQGTRLVGTLMSMVEVELAARGVRFLTRNAKIPSGYADKVARHYRDRIIERHDHESPWGPQRWFRIKL